MNEINEFLSKRPLISVNGLEAKLSIPLGTIRVSSNKQIPNKYVDDIISELSQYGYENNKSQTSDKVSQIPDKINQTSDKPVTTQATDYFIKDNSIFYKDKGINRRASFPDNTKVLILP